MRLLSHHAQYGVAEELGAAGQLPFLQYKRWEPRRCVIHAGTQRHHLGWCAPTSQLRTDSNHRLRSFMPIEQHGWHSFNLPHLHVRLFKIEVQHVHKGYQYRSSLLPPSPVEVSESPAARCCCRPCQVTKPHPLLSKRRVRSRAQRIQHVLDEPQQKCTSVVAVNFENERERTRRI